MTNKEQSPEEKRKQENKDMLKRTGILAVGGAALYKTPSLIKHYIKKKLED